MKRKFYRAMYKRLGRIENWFWLRWMDTYPQSEHTYTDDQ